MQEHSRFPYNPILFFFLTIAADFLVFTKHSVDVDSFLSLPSVSLGVK